MKPDLVFRRPIPVADSLSRAEKALATIGTVVLVDRESGRVKGKVMTALHVAELDIHVRPIEDHSEISVRSFAWELGAFATDSAVRRFAEAFDNYDNPEYKPDRTGIPTYAIVLMIVFGIVMQIIRFLYHF